MDILLSIKPKYANLILEGHKKYELRKSIFKRKGIKKVVIYSSTPVQKVVGEFDIEQILEDDVDVIWNETKSASCVDREFFYKYFENKKRAYAIKIGNVYKYEEAKSLKDFNILFAPQSFVYIGQ